MAEAGPEIPRVGELVGEDEHDHDNHGRLIAIAIVFTSLSGSTCAISTRTAPVATSSAIRASSSELGLMIGSSAGTPRSCACCGELRVAAAGRDADYVISRGMLVSARDLDRALHHGAHDHILPRRQR